MNWEPTAIYKMTNGTDKVNFMKNVEGRFLIADHKTNINKFSSTKQARIIWKEYQSKGYKKV